MQKRNHFLVIPVEKVDYFPQNQRKALELVCKLCSFWRSCFERFDYTGSDFNPFLNSICFQTKLVK